MVDLAKTGKAIATSRTLAGGLSLFGMLAGNVRFQGTLWLGTYPVSLEDGNIVLALIALGFVALGRAKAPGPLVVHKPQPADEAKGFPRHA